MCDATTVRTSPEEALRADLKSVARAACPALGDLDPALLEVVQISGGITNLLYKVSGGGGAAAAAALSVLVRIYGPNTEILINREEECDLFEELAGLKFGPPYLGRFSNGRVEGYLDQSRALEPDDMGATDPIDMISLIAQEMARMHSLQEPSKQESLRSLHLYKYKEAVREVRQRLEGLHSSSSFADAFMADPVLCHGDLLSGNILHSSTWKRVQFIDFEYSAYNPRGFDFANHWNEYAGFDSDFENKYPRDELQRKFMEAYLKASWPEILAQSKKEDMLGALCRAANRYSVASHLFWGMWAVIQSKYSPIDFDFLNYARLRFVGYEAHCKWLSE